MSTIEVTHKPNGESVAQQALELVKQAPDALAIQRAPDLVLQEAHRAAKALTDVIEAKPRKVVFNGKTYLQFEDWQTLGRFYGVTVVGRSTKYVEFGEGEEKVVGFEAAADALLVATNQVISSAEAMCLNDEANWSKKPLFQLKSMAQTRACAKALRNVLAWVVVLAGYAPTPAEEMEHETAEPRGRADRGKPRGRADRGKARNQATRDVTVNMAPDPCTRCGGPIGNMTHKVKGKDLEFIPWQRIRDKAIADFKRPVCGACQIKIAHGEPLGDPLKPSDKAKPAAEGNRGHGDERLNKTHIEPFDNDPDLVEVTGWLQSVKLIDGKKPFLALKFADGAEISSWHVGKGALTQLESEGVGKACAFICTVKQKGEKTYYNLDSILRLGEHDYTVDQAPEPEPPAEFTGATDEDIPF